MSGVLGAAGCWLPHIARDAVASYIDRAAGKLQPNPLNGKTGKVPPSGVFRPSRGYACSSARRGVSRKLRRSLHRPFVGQRGALGNHHDAVADHAVRGLLGEVQPRALTIRTWRPMRQFLSMIAPSMCVPQPTPSGGRPLLLPAAISSGAS